MDAASSLDASSERGRAVPDLDQPIERVGVRRISLATSLYRAAMSSLLEAAREVKDTGTFSYLDRSLTTPELNGFMRS